MRAISRNRLVGAWTSFLTTTGIFLLIGFLIFYRDSGEFPWWCAFVPAITLVEAIRVTITYLAGENTRVCPNCQKMTPVSNQFCDKCGFDLRSTSYQTYQKIEIREPEESEPIKPVIDSKNYCSTCGGPLGGSEAYCPTCGMPLKK